MCITESLEKRRSYYQINRQLPVGEEVVEELVRRMTELVPDAFNMKSSRVVLVFGKKQDILWDSIYDIFEGKVPREKIEGFKAGSGTVLYCYDSEVVKDFQEKFSRYADNFPDWAKQASAMLQLAVWSRLRELGIGASLQHYNPVIDAKVRELFHLPQSYVLVAQMPFGGIAEEPGVKANEDISERVRVER